ncbi:folate transporter 1 [Halyomorpha halys]|uniref:folate transporter 1 n=1 Tax=Halyomorpha halys TaxID=286706 RepID=UPI0006D4DC79|nr:folate transporter 1-like [Halyomorpha halys]XP_014294390.1 folate transporter 1-like [Halyomorpha halys]XP_014294391.1 folate transporter 1-like [Halyomorpha halys]XP_014294392.1 folate transporter 1-like [Halyomorpha halys]XP_014294393.1 folate transporter 1-like [Halyomorpha halys]XP_014294395.1 folate transporter 1-like [Halyomorpha halys]
METWKKISVLLCVFGVLKEFRPAEPYITKMLNNPPLNFTLEQISEDLYPVSIYTAMISLVLVFLLTDLLRYKPIIISGNICAIMVYFLLIVGRSIFLMQVLEVFYGLFMAAEVAYYTYIYAKVDKCHYQEVSGHTRSAYLVGRTVSGVVSQLYIFLRPTDYFTLNYFTLAGMILATIWAFFLPSVEHSVYFNRDVPASSSTDYLEDESNTPCTTVLNVKKSTFRKSISFLKNDFYYAVSNLYTLKWMFWLSLATGGYYQVLSYVQVLWEQILNDNNSTIVKSDTLNNFNGGVETLYTLLSAGSAYGCGIVTVKWSRYGEVALFLCSTVIAALLYIMSQTTEILFAFGLYILYAVIYNGMITIVNSEIAQNVNPDSHGLIFGFTTFLALVFQSILTIVVSSELLTINERMKFVIYSCYFAFLGLVFLIITVVKVLRSRLCSAVPTDSDI